MNGLKSMKKVNVLFLVLMMTVALIAAPAYYANKILFSLDANVQPLTSEQLLTLETPYPELNKIIKKWDVVKIEPWLPNAKETDHDGDVYLNRIYRLTMNVDVEAPSFVAGEIANSSTAVQHAEPEAIMQTLAKPNDPRMGDQWYLYKAQVQEAWNLWDLEGGEIPGDRRIVIAVVDDGVEYTHPDLWKNIWINQDEIPATYFPLVDANSDGFITAEEAVNAVGDISGNGEANLKDVIAAASYLVDNLDNDGDGYIDNIIGWDTDAESSSSDDDRDPMVTNNSHGTHVAGLAGATTDNNTGVASAAYNISIMPVKATGDETTNSINTGWSGILYAAQAGADIINCSWGGPGYNSYSQNIINDVYNNYHSLIVAAAGNGDDDGNPSDEPHYPSGYDHVVSVTAVSSNDIFSWANYGAASGNFYGVDLSAPGESMLSTYLTKQAPYNYLNGTSMASPFVASCFALLKSVYPDSSNDWLVDHMLANTDPIDDKNPDYAGQLGTGRINILKALAADKWPSLTIKNKSLAITAGDGDNVLNPGETVKLMVEVKNDTGWATASNLAGILRTNEAGITITDSLATWTSIPQNTSALNDGNGFSVTFSDDLLPGIYDFELILEPATDEGFSYHFKRQLSISISLEQEGFPFAASTEVESSPLIVDIDHNGDQEIVFGDKGGNIYVLDHMGDTIPGFPVMLGSQTGGVAVADIDLDDTLEIVATAFNKLISVYDITGKKEWTRHTNFYITAMPAIGNLDDDPELEVVVGSYDQNIYAINHDSTDVDGFPYASGQLMHSGVSLADLNNDNKDDIVYVSKAGQLGVLNSDGTMMDGWPLDVGGSTTSEPQVIITGDTTGVILWGNDMGDMYGYDLNGTQRFMIDGTGAIKASPAIGEFAGKPYAFFGTSQGEIYKIDLAGDSVSVGWPVEANGIYHSLVVADVLDDGSSEPHVLALGNNGYIYAYDMSGQTVSGFPINTKFLSKSALAISDIDNDLDPDIISGNYSGVSVTDLKSTLQSIEWPMHRGSADRKGSITYLMSAIDDNYLPSKFELIGNAPNPFNPSTLIKYQVSNDQALDLKVYSLNGRLVLNKHINSPKLGINTLELNMNNYSSGLYLYTLKQADQVRSSKMILLK
jgi:hypothetical protein